MLKIVQCKDSNLIKQVMTTPKIWNAAVEDNSPVSRETWEPIMEGILWIAALKVEDSKRTLYGMWMLCPISSTVIAIHTGILPKYWGKPENVEFAKLAAQWIWENTPARKVVSYIPVTLPNVLKFAQRAGMKLEGINERSFLKDGKLIDQYYVGLCKE